MLGKLPEILKISKNVMEIKPTSYPNKKWLDLCYCLVLCDISDNELNSCLIHKDQIIFKDYLFRCF